MQADASAVGLGACLLIERAGKLRPVSFASKLLTSTERNYSTPEHEALAIVWALEKFNQFLFGRPFILHSDQSSLGSLFTRFGDKPTVGRRIKRWFERLQHYDYKLRHISGKENVIADYLSRLSENAQPSTEPSLSDDNDNVILISALSETSISHNTLLAEITNDQFFQRVLQYVNSNWPTSLKKIRHSDLRRFWKIRDEISAQNGLIFRSDRLVIPSSLREKILDRLQSGHPGIMRMKQLYSDIYYWLTGLLDCEEQVSACVPCSMAEKSS
ncbi:MAG: hypothetical protein GY696_27005, partial [Gammaproteobacteria bacterium]|nr:hypothetical protein [Gammaproteobacteria bacterium]